MPFAAGHGPGAFLIGGAGLMIIFRERLGRKVRAAREGGWNQPP
ncbi:hypothetical protein [Neorhizobium sp. LjRoot104]